MSDMMTFPDTVEEFMDDYKVVDTEGIYMGKGSELVPIFRMKQWFEHVSAQPEITMCKDCIFGRLYLDMRKNIGLDSWVECVNPDGLYRDVSCEGYCYAAIKREDQNADVGEEKVLLRVR